MSPLCTPTFHCAHPSNHTEKNRNPSDRHGQHDSPSVLSHYPSDRKRNPTETRCIPLVNSHISALSVCSCVCTRVCECARAAPADCARTGADRLLLELRSLSSQPLLSRTFSVQSGESMADRKPITRSFPPDPQLNAQWSGLPRPGMAAARRDSDAQRSNRCTAFKRLLNRG